MGRQRTQQPRRFVTIWCLISSAVLSVVLATCIAFASVSYSLRVSLLSSDPSASVMPEGPIRAVEITRAVHRNAFLVRGVNHKVSCAFSFENLTDALVQLCHPEGITSADRRQLQDRVKNRVRPDINDQWYSVHTLRAGMLSLDVQAAMSGNAWAYMDTQTAEKMENDGHVVTAVANEIQRERRSRAFFVPVRAPPVAAQPAHAPSGPSGRGGPAAQAAGRPREEADEADEEQDDSNDENCEVSHDDDPRATIKELTRKLRNAVSRKCYWKNKAKKLQEQGRKEQEEKNAHSYTRVTKKGKLKPKYSRLSMRGGYKAALKRGCGHGSSIAVILSIGLKITDHALWPWEKLLAANLLSQAQAFFKRQYQRIEAFLDKEIRRQPEVSGEGLPIQ